MKPSQDPLNENYVFVNLKQSEATWYDNEDGVLVQAKPVKPK